VGFEPTKRSSRLAVFKCEGLRDIWFRPVSRSLLLSTKAVPFRCPDDVLYHLVLQRLVANRVAKTTEDRDVFAKCSKIRQSVKKTKTCKATCGLSTACVKHEVRPDSMREGVRNAEYAGSPRMEA